MSGPQGERQGERLFVVLVKEPLPQELSGVLSSLEREFGLSEARARRLLGRGAGPITKPVPEAQARRVAGALNKQRVRVEVREGSRTGPVMEWLLPEAEGVTPALPAEPVPRSRRRARAPRGKGTAQATRAPAPLSWRALLRGLLAAAVLLMVLLAASLTLAPLIERAAASSAVGAANRVAGAALEASERGEAPAAAAARLAAGATERLRAEGVEMLLVIGADGEELFSWGAGKEAAKEAGKEAVVGAAEPSEGSGSGAAQVGPLVSAFRAARERLVTVIGRSLLVGEGAPLALARAPLGSGADAGMVIAGSHGKETRREAQVALAAVLLGGLVAFTAGALARRRRAAR